jgi:hypothetical protein
MWAGSGDRAVVLAEANPARLSALMGLTETAAELTKEKRAS